jgi:hypothetical protein
LTVSSNSDVSFTSQPTNVTVNVGSSASFSVAVTGGGNYSYLWIKNDADPITNTVATNATLTFSNAALSDNAYYTCYVNNDCSTFFSAPATLTVKSTNVASVVISEIYASGGKTSATYSNDYVVLKNTGGTSQNLNGWSLQHQKAGAWQVPFVLPNVSILPGGYYLIKCYNDGGTAKGTLALPTPDATTPQTSTWNLSTSSSESVALVNTTNQLTPNNTNIVFTAGFSSVVDVVGFVSATATNSYLGTGAAPASTITNSVVRLQSGCQNTPDNSLDFALSSGAPAPQNSASAVSLCVSTAPPTISGQPQSQSLAAGGSLTLVVSASGSSPLAYQWRVGGSAITGATSPIYSISPVATNNSGNYDVVITNLYGSITSSAAVINITNIPPSPPSITQQPQSQSVLAGSTASFSVVATGTPVLGYQWRSSGVPVGGATLSSYSVSAVTTNVSGATFDVVITNAYGSVTSSVATLTVAAPQTVSSVASTNRATVRDGSNFNLDIDENTAGYVLIKYSAAGAAAKGYFQFNLTGQNPNTSQPATFSYVTPSSSGAQNMTLWVLNQAYPSMNNAIVWATAQANETNTDNMLTNGAFTATALTNLSLTGGAASNTITLPGSWGQYLQSNTITFVLTGDASGGVANSTSGYRIMVTNSATPPLFTYTPGPTGPVLTQFYPGYYFSLGFFSGFNMGTTNLLGMNLSVWSSTNPFAPVGTWFNEGLMQEQPLADVQGSSRYSINVTPSVSPTYYILASTNVGPFTAMQPIQWVTLSDFGGFSDLIFLTNTYGIDSNGVLQLPSAPYITQQPTNVTVLAGKNATFTVLTGGSNPKSYQWYFNTNNLIANATNASYSIATAASNNAGKYRVVITNIYGSVTSSNADLAVVQAPSLGVTPTASGTGIQISGSAVVGIKYVVQSSTDLAANPTVWTPVYTNTVGANGIAGYTNVNPPGHVVFYRVVFP